MEESWENYRCESEGCLVQTEWSLRQKVSENDTVGSVGNVGNVGSVGSVVWA